MPSAAKARVAIARRQNVAGGGPCRHAAADVILLTDRPSDGHRLVSALGLANTCAVIGVHQVITRLQTASVVICDVALDNVATTELLQSALASLRQPGMHGVVFLARDPSQLTLAQAKALGVEVILPSGAPPAEINAAVRGLLTKGQSVASTASAAADPVRAGVSKATTALGDMFLRASRNQAMSTAVLERGGDAIINAIQQSSIQSWLDLVWRFDDLTYQHCLLVAGLVAAFTFKLGLSLPQQRLLAQAALLHDVGKAKIPHAILNKPSALTADELKIMRTHASIGFDMLVRQRDLDARLLDVVRHHHEYIDGSGYPDGLRGNQISQFVRATTICDIYAAMIERRPYKHPKSSESAFGILHEMRGKIDENLLVTFEAMIVQATPEKLKRVAIG
jgi:putative nucleotidyltransferase with HDIG domain